MNGIEYNPQFLMKSRRLQLEMNKDYFAFLHSTGRVAVVSKHTDLTTIKETFDERSV